MNAPYARQLFAYTTWADRELLRCVETLTDAQFAQPLPYSIGAVRDHVLHIASVEWWWLRLLETGQLEFLFTDEDSYHAVTREQIPALWARVHDNAARYLATVTDDDLWGAVKPPFWEEHERPVRRWEGLMQVANHSTDHRAQVLRALHDFGAPTFEQDYLNFVDGTSLPERG